MIEGQELPSSVPISAFGVWICLSLGNYIFDYPWYRHFDYCHCFHYRCSNRYRYCRCPLPLLPLFPLFHSTVVPVIIVIPFFIFWIFCINSHHPNRALLLHFFNLKCCAGRTTFQFPKFGHDGEGIFSTWFSTWEGEGQIFCRLSFLVFRRRRHLRRL